MLVAGAVEVADGAPGRIRLAEIQDFSAAWLMASSPPTWIEVATIKTDGWAAYPGALNVAHDPKAIPTSSVFRFNRRRTYHATCRFAPSPSA